MNFRESINKLLEETYNFFYELNLNQHNNAQIVALKAFGELIGVDTNDKSQLSNYLSSPEGLKFMKLFRVKADKHEIIDDPVEWGHQVAKEIYDELYATQGVAHA